MSVHNRRRRQQRSPLRPVCITVGRLLIFTATDAEGRLGRHVAKLRTMALAGQLASVQGVQDLTVSHDDGCGIFAGQLCDCDPDVRLRADPDTLAVN